MDPNLWIEVPKAHGFDVVFCGHCPNAHIIFNDGSRIICAAVLSASQAEGIAKSIRERDPNFRQETV